MNFIIDPISNNKFNIFSNKGQKLLKSFIKQYQTGGSNIEKYPIYCDEDETNCAWNAEQNEKLYNILNQETLEYKKYAEFTKTLNKYIKQNKDDKSCYNYRCSVIISYTKPIILPGGRIYNMNGMYNHHFSILQCNDDIKLCDGWENIHPMICRYADIDGILKWINNLQKKLKEIFETNKIHDFKNLFGEEGLFEDKYPVFNKQNFQIKHEDEKIDNPEWTNDNIQLLDPKYKFKITISKLKQPQAPAAAPAGSASEDSKNSEKSSKSADTPDDIAAAEATVLAVEKAEVDAAVMAADVATNDDSGGGGGGGGPSTSN